MRGDMVLVRFCECDSLATVEVVTFRLHVMILVGKGYVANAGEWVGMAGRQWKQSTQHVAVKQRKTWTGKRN